MGPQHDIPQQQVLLLQHYWEQQHNLVGTAAGILGCTARIYHLTAYHCLLSICCCWQCIAVHHGLADIDPWNAVVQLPPQEKQQQRQHLV
jgi:hypothetical protein